LTHNGHDVLIAGTAASFNANDTRTRFNVARVGLNYRFKNPRR
jgi:hypothetical protein